MLKAAVLLFLILCPAWATIGIEYVTNSSQNLYVTLKNYGPDEVDLNTLNLQINGMTRYFLTPALRLLPSTFITVQVKDYTYVCGAVSVEIFQYGERMTSATYKDLKVPECYLNPAGPPPPPSTPESKSPLEPLYAFLRWIAGILGI